VTALALEGTVRTRVVWGFVLACLVTISGSFTQLFGRMEPTALPRSTERQEPCRVEVQRPQWRDAAQKWCEGGLFTLVNVSQDPKNIVVRLHMSNKGQRVWSDKRSAVLDMFRGFTDEIVEKTDMNAAFFLHDTNARMVGRCVRTRGAREATCR
jgi:hypothetical protein